MPVTTPPTAAATPTDRQASAARTIEQLAHSALPENRFFDDFLTLLVEATGAEAGAVWRLNHLGVLYKLSQVGVNLPFETSSLAARFNTKLVLESLQTRQSKSFQPQPQTQGDRLPAINRTLVVVPISSDQAPGGAVELIFDRDAGESERTGQTEFAEEMCIHAARYLRWRAEATSPASLLGFWTGFERMLSELHRSLDTSQIALAAVNDARQLLGCDRVSLALLRGSKTRIIAVSGQERIASRSNAIRRLAAIADESIWTGREITWQGTDADISPELKDDLLDYLQEGGVQTIKVIPIRPPADAPGPDIRPDQEPEPFAALIVEQFSEGWLTPAVADRAGLLGRHIGAALENARTHEGVFLLRSRRFLGRLFGRLEGRSRRTAGIVFLVLATVFAGLCWVEAPYRIPGQGKLMPVLQREIFAPLDGEIDEIHVTSGQRVAKGQVLLRLRNEELSAQILAIRNQLETERQHLAALEASYNEQARVASGDKLIDLQGRVAQGRVKSEGLQQRLDSLQRQIDSLAVRSPIDGTVTTYQLEQLLMHRPVRRGEMLLEVMDESGPWQLELDVAEQRVGHLLDAWQDIRGDQPNVRFVLATKPEATYSGSVRAISARTDLSPEIGSVVEVAVDVDRDAIPHRRIGAEVRAKIDCGRRSAAYVLFGDFVEFVQRHVW